MGRATDEPLWQGQKPVLLAILTTRPVDRCLILGPLRLDVEDTLLSWGVLETSLIGLKTQRVYQMPNFTDATADMRLVEINNREREGILFGFM